MEISFSVIPDGKSRDDRPELGDLFINVIPQYATRWEALGAILGLKDYEIAVISKDNTNRSIEGCTAMLMKWLQSVDQPTWGKLDDAINLLRPSLTGAVTDPLVKGTVVSQLSRHVKGVYKQTRFDVGKDTWPPEQPRDFTPVVLVHYEEQRTMKDVNIITKAVHTGHISDVISAASSQPVTKRHRLDSHQPLREALQTSKVTRNVADILKPFDQCDDPQTILIEGAPGIGKSILMKHISYCWAEGEVMKKIQLVLLICLRDPGVQKMRSLQQLLQSFLTHITHSEGDIATCIQCLQQDNGKSLAVLLDGYDEFPEGLRENSLIADIINRKVLPECGLIVSSRPHASQHLHNKATLRVDILGFTETERQHFIEQSLKVN